MNERIRELALQAKLGSALLLHHWGTVNALTDSEQNELEQIEKFAELIVQETMQVVANQLPSNQYLDVADAVIKHFGVEEWTGNNATLC